MILKSVKIIFIVIIVVLAASVAALQLYHRNSSDRAKSDQEYLALLRQVIAIVKKSYVEEVDEKKLVKGAINGMLSSLDPHSVYMPADSFKEMKISTTGSFGGLGIEITIRDGKLTVISPIEETPGIPGRHQAGRSYRPDRRRTDP